MPSSYALSASDEEYQRLRDQARLYEGYAKEIFRELGVREGMRCLDVGCGPGEVMRLMGEIAGRSGMVTGFDADKKIGAEALSALAQSGSSNFRFVEGDVNKVDRISGEEYDLVYSRFLLPHLRDVPAVLKKMYNCVKPGGYLVVQDRDFVSASVYPPNTLVDAILTRSLLALERAGVDARIGRKLRSYFVQAGIGAPDGTRVNSSLRPVSHRDTFTVFRGSAQAALALAVKFGMTAKEKGEEELEALDRLPDKDSYFFLTSLFVTVWRRKPPG
jgi:ubiquinone/menaquinone biosynthesis C-methylase UbiE